MSATVAIAWLGIVTFFAIAVACMAALRTRAARAALRAREGEHGQNVELAKQQMQATGRLAGDVAHDVTDLLTAIAGHAELLIASLDPSGTSIQDAHEIRRAALRAAQLTKPLRTLTGEHYMSTDVLDVNAVTTRTVTSLQQMMPKIDVTLTLDNDIKRIRIAQSHLEEIVLNLCIHARDAMPYGGRLTVTTTMHTHDGRDATDGVRGEYVRMIVADTGAGMSAAAQSRLFEPFFASDKAGGNAVGLAKVDAIVRQAGGRIHVKSEVGVGTMFMIDLPATAEPAVLSDPAPAETRVAAPVLVVEDEPQVRELIRLVLVRAGHEVVAVAGPHLALAALNRQPAIALMLVDVVMPEMDGYDLAAAARKVSPDVHVVFMSAFARDTTRHPEGDGFLAKPFTVESLTGIVEKALSRCRVSEVRCRTEGAEAPAPQGAKREHTGSM